MLRSKFFKPPPGEGKKHTYESPLEKRLAAILSPFQEFSESLITASIFLLSATLIALIAANVPYLASYYQKMINFEVYVVFGKYRAGGDLKYWVNDILLTFFFFLVGLEIKREFIAGELVKRKRALLTIFAAVGGMIVPAALFSTFNYGLPTIHGWGIPMATDTAFALGVLAVFRKTLPSGLFTFIAALAIIDDIGAIIVIVTFYSQKTIITYLILAFLMLGFLMLGNLAGIRRSGFYLVGGAVVWYLLEYAGIHGVIAGVLVALCIPARPARGPRFFINKINALLNYFEKRKNKIPKVIEDKKQHTIIEELRETAKNATTPLQCLESRLDLPVSLFVLPIFALFNAGILLNYDAIETSLHSALTWGIIVGLFLGKPLGITLFSFAALKMHIGMLPKNTTFKHLMSVSLLAGIGFTMSLFIANLAFSSSEQLLELAKTGILFGSLLSGIVGMVWLSFLKEQNPKSGS